RFEEVDGQARQTILANMPLRIVLEDCAGASEATLRQRVAEEIRQPFDLARGPLLRVRLLALAGQEHVLVITQHHIVSDGWSMQVMVEELVQLYAAYSRGLEVALPALPIQYADYALWQRS
uniref:condensation domain-containing protein n=1 Tax=Pseudomonas aeruginosa TaxID=287 RepID=UPI003CF259FF